MSRLDPDVGEHSSGFNHDSVCTQLNRILNSEQFADTTRLKRFLEYVVNQSLAGNASRLKGYTLGLEVFDRPDDFDPQLDSIVRVQAAELRRRLDLYYSGSGRADPIRICLPRGTYAPTFEAPGERAEANAASRPESQSSPSIAVLPFQNYSADPGDQFFADGLTEESIANLARFKDLFVFSRSTTAKLARDGADIRRLREELGVDFVVEGSVRKSPHNIRATVQLIDAATDGHIFTEQIDRPFTPEGLFEIQDEIAALIASRIADRYGPLGRHASRTHRAGQWRRWETYDWITRFYDWSMNADPENHLKVRDGLERVLERDPASSDGWSALSLLLTHEFALHINERLDYPILDRCREHAQRAVACDPENAFAYQALAMAHFHREEFTDFQVAAKRAVELNPGHADVLADIGVCHALLGEWDRGLPLVDRAIELSPVHPGWYHLPRVVRFLMDGDPTAAFFECKEGQMPGFFWYHAFLVACLAEIGDSEGVRKETEQLEAVYPAFAENAHRECQIWMKHDAMIQTMMEAWRKAGLDVR